MSTVKAINFQHPSATAVNLTLAADGTVSGNAPWGGRNYILNGSFAVAQRGTSFTLSNVQASSYTLDRWQTYRPANPTAITVSQQTGSAAAGLTKFVRMQRTASNTSTDVTTLSQSVEILNASQLAGQTVTLSFYARGGANFSGSLTAKVQTGTGSTDNGGLYNVWTGSAFPISQTPALTTSWQRFQYTATFGSSVTQTEVRFDWTPSGTAGAADNVDIAGVQVEVGAAASPFEVKKYGQELAECERYFQRFTGYSSSEFFVPVSFYLDANSICFPLQCNTMRDAPVVTYSGTANTDYKVLNNGSPQSGFTFTYQKSTLQGTVLTATKNSHGVPNVATVTLAVFPSGAVNLSAEL